MNRQNPFLSPLGCLGGVVTLVLLSLSLVLTGGKAFSPGLLSAQASRGTPLGGTDNHMAIETQCARCHVPFRGISADRCTACHIVEGEELTRGEGLHGKLINGPDCAACHSDHRGRDALISQTDPVGFDHQRTGYSLAAHLITYDGQPFNCRDCHVGQRFTFEQNACTGCHAGTDAAFMDAHDKTFGEDCLACHDGIDTMATFDHEAVFALVNGHAGLDCADCHDDGFLETSAECATCHAEPELHVGKFGTECAACHALEAWTPALLVDHAFPLDHGGEGEIGCAICHEADYVNYTCYNCHEHESEEIRSEHLEKDIRDFQNCAKCHPTGLKEESEDREAAIDILAMGG